MNFEKQSTLETTRINFLLIRTGRFCFNYSLLIGTEIFLACLATDLRQLHKVGAIFSLAAFAINGLLVFALIVLLFTNSRHQKLKVATIGLLLLNIPVFLCYTVIAILIDKI